MKTIRFKIDFHKLIHPLSKWLLTGIYNPNTVPTDKLHFRPLELDIWYPSSDKKGAEPVR
jgi:hypothetical protein